VRVANKVVLDTEMNAQPVARSCEEIQKDIDRVTRAKEKLQERFDKFEFAGGNKASKTFQNMRYDADKLNTKMFDLQDEMSRAMASNGEEEKAKKIEQVKTASEKASKSIRKMGDSSKKSKSGFNIGLKSILKYAFGIRSLFVLVNKLRSAMVDGFKNLAQFNDGVNPANTALSNLKSALTQLKNSFAVAFAPILTVVEPILTRLISLLSSAMNTIGQFFAALTGAKTFNKAVKAQENYAKSLNGTASAAKKTKNELYSFDELNVVKQGDDSSGGGSSGGGASVSPNQMFETENIDAEISGLAERVKSALGDMFSVIDISPLKQAIENAKQIISSWLSKLNLEPLKNSFKNFLTSLNPVINGISKAIVWLLENALLPLAKFTIEDALPAFFDLLAKGIDTVVAVLEVLKPSIEYLWTNIIAPLAQFLGEMVIEVINIIIETLNDFILMLQEHSDQINNIIMFVLKVIELAKVAVQTAIQFVVGMLKPFLKTIVNIIGHIIDALSGVVDFLTGVFTGNWEKAWEGIKEVFRGIWNVIIDLLEGFINMIIGGLNKINVSVPDWVPEIGGKSFGFNLEPISIPRLATGTVVPRQSREFAAILGDNNRETEVVSPLSTMKQAMLEALSEHGGGGNGDVYISADGDLDAIVRLFKFRIDKENNRVGRSFEKVVTV
jgi:phage-related protein